MENLIELGAIEVIPAFRGHSVGKTLLAVSMMDPQMEKYIIITTEYYWHWDLKGTNKDVWEYRKMMEKMMNAGGLCLVCDRRSGNQLPSRQLFNGTHRKRGQSGIDRAF